MFGEFPRRETITGMRQAFEKEAGKLAVSHRGKCTFEYFTWLEEQVLKLRNQSIDEYYDGLGDDL